MSDIQKARDVLVKWREQMTLGPWRFSPDSPRWVWGSEPGIEVADLMSGDNDARLIVGTAGNPDLLDAIDGLLARAIDLADISESEPLVVHAKCIAYVILAADERMSA